MKNFLKVLSVSLLILLGVLAFAAVGGWIFREDIISKGEVMLDEMLVSQGYFISYERSPWSTETGFELSDITIYETKAKKQPSAILTGAQLQIPISASLRDGAPHIFCRAKDAELTFFSEQGDTKLKNLELDLQVVPGQFTLQTLKGDFQGIALDLQADAELPEVEEAESVAPSEPAPDEAPKELVSALDFSAVPKLAAALDYRAADFGPGLSLKVTSTLAEGDAVKLTLAGETKSFPSAGKDLKIAGTILTNPDGTVGIDDLKIEDGEQHAEVQGELSENSVLRLAKLESNLDWITILRGLPGAEEQLPELLFTRPPAFTATGDYDLKAPEKSQLNAEISDAAFAWTLSGEPARVLTIDKLTTNAKLSDGQLDLSDLVAELLDGQILGSANYTPFASEPAWEADVTGSNVSLAQITTLSGTDPVPGVTGLQFKGSGGLKPESINGEGRMTIERGNFVSAPIVGNLLKVLGNLLPLIGEHPEDEATTSFQIQDGVFTSNDLRIAVSAAEVGGKGSIDLGTLQTKLEAKASLRGKLKVISSSLSDTLAFTGEGPISDVRWRSNALNKAVSNQTKSADLAAELERAIEGSDSLSQGDKELLRDAGEQVLGGFLRDLGMGRPKADPAVKPSEAAPNPGQPIQPTEPEVPAAAPPKAKKFVPPGG